MEAEVVSSRVQAPAAAGEEAAVAAATPGAAVEETEAVNSPAAQARGLVAEVRVRVVATEEEEEDAAVKFNLFCAACECLILKYLRRWSSSRL